MPSVRTKPKVRLLSEKEVRELVRASKQCCRCDGGNTNCWSCRAESKIKKLRESGVLTKEILAGYGIITMPRRENYNGNPTGDLLIIENFGKWATSEDSTGEGR